MLDGRLREGTPINARGVAALLYLLTDGNGPLYTHGDPATLRRRLQAIEAWMVAPA